MSRIGRQLTRGRGRRPKLPPVVVVLLLLITALSRFWKLEDSPSVATLPEGGTALVERVIDGDTFVIAGGQRVRLIGVDTPETRHPQRPPEPFGAEATAFTRRLVDGREVRLEFDRERHDRYQRILAYVYVDDLFLNEELVRVGLAKAQPQYPYRSDIKRRFLQAEEQARLQKLGIWSLE